MLTPTVPADSVCRLLYTGAVGTAGVDAAISIDLSALPESILVDPDVRDNWRVFIRQVDDGITAVDGEVEFTPAAPAAPTAMVITLTAASVNDILDLEAVYTPTQVR